MYALYLSFQVSFNFCIFEIVEIALNNYFVRMQLINETCSVDHYRIV
jgi:hypothetical protein